MVEKFRAGDSGNGLIVAGTLINARLDGGTRKSNDGRVYRWRGWREMNVVSPAQCCFDGVTKDRPAREQTNDRGSENK